MTSTRHLATTGLPFTVALALCWGCATGQPDGLGSPEVPEHVRDKDAGEPAAEATDTQPAATPDYVNVDLDEHGITATLHAPGKVEVNATDDGVELVSEEGFHLLVGRGSLDMTSERAELVRAFGDEFVRFLDDTPDLAVWEIRNATGNRFHFFATHGSGDDGYHCKTPPDGVESPQLVELLVEVCGAAGSPKAKKSTGT